jgi:hypothetical protein
LADEAATNIPSHDTAVSIPAADHADGDTVEGNWTTDHWTPEEDAKLKIACMDTCQKKHGIRRTG